MGNLTRKEIVNQISKKLKSSVNLTFNEIDACVMAFISELKDGLQSLKTIELRGFGTFELKRCAFKANTRNPRTGEVFETKEHYKVAFRSGRDFDKKIRSLE